MLYSGDEVYGDDVTSGIIDEAAYEAQITPEMQAEHDRHFPLGENHWFTCFLCDDEGNDD